MKALLVAAGAAIFLLTGCFSEDKKAVDDKRPDKITVLGTLVQVIENGKKVEKHISNHRRTCTIGNPSVFCPLNVDIPGYRGLGGSEPATLVFDQIANDPMSVGITVKRSTIKLYALISIKGEDLKSFNVDYGSDTVKMPWLRLASERPVVIKFAPKSSLGPKQEWQYRISAKAASGES